MRPVVRDAISGALTSIVSLAYSLSCAALIFSGPLAYGLAFGITASLIAMAVCALATALLSPFRNAIAGVDGNAAAVLSTMAAAMAVQLQHDDVSSGAALVTILAAIAIATICTAVVLGVLGALRAARWVRFVPYPVMGGFIAAVGWLLVVGSVRVATGIPADFAHAAALARPPQVFQVLATFAFAITLIVIVKRTLPAIALTIVLVAGTVIGDVVLALLPGGLQGAAAAGWFPLAGDRNGWMPWYLDTGVHAIAWPVIAQSWPLIATVVMVSVITILINATAFELVSKTDVDLDGQLRADGVGNVASVLLGGMVGYFALARSVVNFRLGATGRASGFTVAIAGAALVFAGSSVGRYVPTYLLAGLLLYVGYTMLDTWIVKTRPTLPRLEWIALLLIVAINVFFGFLYGIVAGLVACTAIFAFNYGRTTAVSFLRTGARYRSTLERSPEELAALVEHGEDIHVILLQGFLFFATADRLFRSFRETVIEGGARYAILDFSRVTGLDGAAATSFVKIARAATRSEVTLVFAAMEESVARQWAPASDHLDDSIPHFADIDHAMEWCENRLIERFAAPHAQPPPLSAWLHREFGDEKLAERLLASMQRKELAEGETLCVEGEAAESMFFIESGHVGISVRRDDGAMHRLRSLGERTMLGEMGLYRRVMRSASAIAEKPSVVFELTRESFSTIESSDPELASAIHRAIVRALSDRLSFQNIRIAHHH